MSSEEVIYHPLTKEGYEELKSVLNGITTHIPKHQMSYIWSTFVLINGVKEPMPCACGSSAGHWRRAMDTLTRYVTKVGI